MSALVCCYAFNNRLSGGENDSFDVSCVLISMVQIFPPRLSSGTNMASLNTELGRDVHNQLSQASMTWLGSTGGGNLGTSPTSATP